MKKTWLNSKEPPPKEVGYFLIIFFLLAIVAVVVGPDGDFISTLIFFVCVILFVAVPIGYIQSSKVRKIIKEVGEKRYQEVNKNVLLITLFECDLLNVCGGRFSRTHLSPPTRGYCGKVQEFWDEEKKNIRYELNFKNGQEHGKWCGWHQNGQLGYEKEYVSNGFLGLGKMHGATKVWDKSGTLLTELIYKNGELIYKK